MVNFYLKMSCCFFLVFFLRSTPGLSREYVCDRLVFPATWAVALRFRGDLNAWPGYLRVACTDTSCISAPGSLESEHDLFYACALRLDLGLYSHPKESAMGVNILAQGINAAPAVGVEPSPLRLQSDALPLRNHASLCFVY
jgi:hypothetical protein